MLAKIHAAPNAYSIRATLQSIAELLFTINRRWIREHVTAGRTPPRSVAECEPPWCPRPIVYRAHHGPRAAGNERDYFDGPSFFHRGEATCIDVAAYDAAALAELDGVPVVVLVEGAVLVQLHCVLLVKRRGEPPQRIDPTAGLRSGETITRPWP